MERSLWSNWKDQGHQSSKDLKALDPDQKERTEMRLLSICFPLTPTANSWAVARDWKAWKHEKAKRYDTERWTPYVGRSQYATGEEWRNSSRKNEGALNQSENNPQVQMWLVMEGKSNTAQEPRMLGPWIKLNWKWSDRRWEDWTLTF